MTVVDHDKIPTSYFYLKYLLTGTLLLSIQINSGSKLWYHPFLVILWPPFVFSSLLILVIG